ncbi:DUF2946 domain-containing protein [Caballeronia sp. J97]|uniref:DUF2946 domain-containing protein n=1 Tax=Caballeronia sp. J97 TaxID=2805429 RepID=UPI002AB02CA3|nr:DUF2946 domain-containing protein [Caballeronia sp. J97]
MTRNARNRFVAWLGIAAMWLAIVAPVISQTLAARNAATDPRAVLCAVDASATDAHAGHHDAASHFDACSYCGLLAHHLPIGAGIAHDVALVERVTRVSPFANVGSVASKSFNAASPRAPPVLS